MKTIISKKLLSVVLSVLCVFSFGMFLYTSQNAENVRAAEGTNETVFEMVNEVYLRTDADGLAFAVKFDESVYNQLTEENSTKRLHFGLVPEQNIKTLIDKVEAGEFDKVALSETNKYYLDISIAKEAIYKKEDGFYYAKAGVEQVNENHRDLNYVAAAYYCDEVIAEGGTTYSNYVFARFNGDDYKKSMSSQYAELNGNILSVENPQELFDVYNWFGNKDSEYPVLISNNEAYGQLVELVNNDKIGNDVKVSIAEGVDTTVAGFTVTLNTNGATSCEELISYTYGVETMLPTPEKDNSIFKGWYTNADCLGESVTKIEKSDFGKKAFYALWYNNVITDKSVGEKTWGNGTVNYSYDAQNGASFKFDESNVVGMGKIKFAGMDVYDSTLQFTVTINASDDWQWNYVVFRGDVSLDNFTALAFRKGGGHIMLLSRVNGVWYSYDNSEANPGNIISGTATTKNCELGTSDILKNLSGDVIDLSIESSKNYVKVYSGQTLIYESPLTLELPSAAGIFYFSSANANPKLALSGVKCYARIDNK